MARVLIVYGTTEGHTRTICQTVAGWLEESGLRADLVDCSKSPSADFTSADSIIVAGSIHETKHQKDLVQFVSTNRVALEARPSLFLSVSLSAVRTDEKHQQDVQRCIDAFLTETRWTPGRIKPVAGALLYTQYSWMKRTLMRMISEKEGGDVDTTKDYVYTDWADLRGTVEAFALPVPV